MVSTLDSESNNPSSNLGRTSIFIFCFIINFYKITSTLRVFPSKGLVLLYGLPLIGLFMFINLILIMLTSDIFEFKPLTHDERLLLKECKVMIKELNDQLNQAL